MRAAANAHPSQTTADHEPLTAAELRLLQYLPSHRTLLSIARELFVAHSTAKTHSLSVYRKLGVNNRAGAIERGVELGLLPPDAQPRPPAANRSLRIVGSAAPHPSGARRTQPSA